MRACFSLLANNHVRSLCPHVQATAASSLSGMDYEQLLRFQQAQQAGLNPAQGVQAVFIPIHLGGRGVCMSVRAPVGLKFSVITEPVKRLLK